MTQRIVIDPVTRIEGHAKITIHLGDDGAVADARLHVAEFRGFEAFCEGRPFWEIPGITARVCGICPVSHLLASSNAGDALLSVIIPPAAAKLRRLMNLAQIVQSHALSFFHLAQIARHFVKGTQIPEGVLNRLEAGIRAFDPCLSCSTHAVGMMPLHVQLVGPDGVVRDEVWRN